MKWEKKREEKKNWLMTKNGIFIVHSDDVKYKKKPFSFFFYYSLIFWKKKFYLLFKFFIVIYLFIFFSQRERERKNFEEKKLIEISYLSSSFKWFLEKNIELWSDLTTIKKRIDKQIKQNKKITQQGVNVCHSRARNL